MNEPSLFQRRHEKARSCSSILPSVDGHSKNNLIHIDLQSFLIAFPNKARMPSNTSLVR